ncbi:MAG: calcium-binding protein [Pseudomonadota bacterium]
MAVSIVLLIMAAALAIGAAAIPSEDEVVDFFVDEFEIDLDFEDEGDPRAIDPASELDDNLPNLGSDWDEVSGGAGNDVIGGGDGFDELEGGSGNDTLSGDNGKDVLAGNSGDDLLDGGSWDDVLDGGTGEDRLRGGTGKDILIGGDGDDRLIGQQDQDVLIGDAGSDFLDGGKNDDLLIGADFLNREVTVEEWHRFLRSDGDTDAFGRGLIGVLSDDGTSDTLIGGAGNDILFLSDEDIGIGGDGQDSFSVVDLPEATGAAIIQDFDPADDKIVLVRPGGAEPEVTVTPDGADAIVRADGAPAARVLDAANDLEASMIETTVFDPDLKQSAFAL